MKRTATLTTYTPWGAPRACIVDIQYRGKILYSFEGSSDEEEALLEKAKIWAANRGFSYTKTTYIVGG